MSIRSVTWCYCCFDSFAPLVETLFLLWFSYTQTIGLVKKLSLNICVLFWQKMWQSRFVLLSEFAPKWEWASKSNSGEWRLLICTNTTLFLTIRSAWQRKYMSNNDFFSVNKSASNNTTAQLPECLHNHHLPLSSSLRACRQHRSEQRRERERAKQESDQRANEKPIHES